MKDGDEVFLADLPLTDRTSIAVSKTAKDWQIEVDSSKLRYPDATVIDSTRVGIGYTGIGKDKIKVKGLIVENTLNSNKQ
jgi:hypothetical protein